MKSYFQENIVGILAILLILFMFTFDFILLLSDNSDPNSSVIAFLRINETLSTLVVGYYFGSSKGSKSKDLQNNEMSKTSAK